MENQNKEKIEKLAEKIFLIDYEFMNNMVLHERWDGFGEEDIIEKAEHAFLSAVIFYKVQKKLP